MKLKLIIWINASGFCHIKFSVLTALKRNPMQWRRILLNLYATSNIILITKHLDAKFAWNAGAKSVCLGDCGGEDLWLFVS